jgi:hypothetical protein
MNELWKPCVGFENYYEISTLGRVRNVKGNFARNCKVNILKTNLCKQGYPRIRFCVAQKKRTFKIHRLVAKAFIDNPRNLPEVNHIDRNKQNNRITNLEWCTRSENQFHAIKTNLNPVLLGDKSRSYTGDVEVYNLEGSLIHILKGSSDMRSKGFEPRQISAVLKGTHKTHKNCTFIKVPKPI